jgi:hypothetical protein
VRDEQERDLFVRPAALHGGQDRAARSAAIGRPVFRARRKGGQTGREAIDHPKGGHDDLANACAGLFWRLFPIVPAPVLVGPLLVFADGRVEGAATAASARSVHAHPSAPLKGGAAPWVPWVGTEAEALGSRRFDTAGS